MFRNLFRECLNGNRKACEKIYYFYWLLPRLERILKKLAGEVAILPVRPPGPGPDPLPDAGFLRERETVLAVLGDPNPQPSTFTREVRLNATIALRDASVKFVESLNKDIQSLEHAD